MYSGQLLKIGKNIGLKRRKSRWPHYTLNINGPIRVKNLETLSRGGRNLLLEENKQQIQNDFVSVKGSLAIEGLILTREEEDLIVSNALGQISDDEFDQKVMELIDND